MILIYSLEKQWLDVLLTEGKDYISVAYILDIL